MLPASLAGRMQDVPMFLKWDGFLAFFITFFSGEAGPDILCS